jgi:fucose 4-O-acetylase-like acetyltransferase
MQKKTHLQIRGFSVTHLKNLFFSQTHKSFNFFHILTCLVDHHMWQSYVNKTWHMILRHSSNVAAWTWRLKLMARAFEALIQRDNLITMTQIVGSHLAKIVGSHSVTNWYRCIVVVDQWIYLYIDYFFDTWLSCLWSTGQVDISENLKKLKMCKCFTEQ